MAAGAELAGAGEGAGVLGALTATTAGAELPDEGEGEGEAGGGVAVEVTGADLGAVTAGVAAMLVGAAV